MLVNSRGLDDFIKSIWWALSGTCSVPLSCNHLSAVILSFSERRAEEEQAFLRSHLQWQGNDSFMVQACLSGISICFTSLYLCCTLTTTVTAPLWSWPVAGSDYSCLEQLIGALEHLLLDFASAGQLTTIGENQLSALPEIHWVRISEPMSCSTVVDVCGLSFEFRSMNQLKYLCGLLLYNQSDYGFRVFDLFLFLFHFDFMFWTQFSFQSKFSYFNSVFFIVIIWRAYVRGRTENNQ